VRGGRGLGVVILGGGVGWLGGHEHNKNIVARRASRLHGAGVELAAVCLNGGWLGRCLSLSRGKVGA